MRPATVFAAVLICGLSCQVQTITPVPADNDSAVTVTFPALAADASGALRRMGADSATCVTAMPLPPSTKAITPE